MLWGARPALIVGFATAFGVAAIGVNVGLIAGYFGGRIDSVMMRITDIFLGLPFLPFIIVMLAITGRSTTTIIVAMTLIMWRSAARVIRAQVLSLKQMPFVAAARTTGAGDFTILYREIAPNVMPIALVNISFALAWAIITEASIGFLGYGDPKSVSWGTIIYDAYASQMMYSGPWWVLPPGIAIMVLVSSVYFVGRAYEQVVESETGGSMTLRPRASHGSGPRDQRIIDQLRDAARNGGRAGWGLSCGSPKQQRWPCG